MEQGSQTTQGSPGGQTAAGDASKPRPGARWAVRVVSALAGVVGVAWGYEFGHRVDGVFMGVVAGANLGIMATVLAGAAAEWAVRRMPR